VSAASHEFLDSIVLIYAFTADPRGEQAQRLLADGCNIGVQGLNEFANVASLKLRMTWGRGAGGTRSDPDPLKRDPAH